jgi:hypothetical protein
MVASGRVGPGAAAPVAADAAPRDARIFPAIRVF